MMTYLEVSMVSADICGMILLFLVLFHVKHLLQVEQLRMELQELRTRLRAATAERNTASTTSTITGSTASPPPDPQVCRLSSAPADICCWVACMRRLFVSERNPGFVALDFLMSKLITKLHLTVRPRTTSYPSPNGQAMAAAGLQPQVRIAPLEFPVDQYISIGSPIGLFLALRKVRTISTASFGNNSLGHRSVASPSMSPHSGDQMSTPCAALIAFASPHMGTCPGALRRLQWSPERTFRGLAKAVAPPVSTLTRAAAVGWAPLAAKVTPDGVRTSCPQMTRWWVHL